MEDWPPHFGRSPPVPAKTPGRIRAEELRLGRRIGFELTRRCWSYETAAAAMGRVGCPMNQSAIHKIVKQKPPRRITVTELAAFAEVFDVPVERLLKPLEAAVSEEAEDLLEELDQRRKAYLPAARALMETANKIAQLNVARDRFQGRHLEAFARAENALIHLVDVSLEPEEELLGDDISDSAVVDDLQRLWQDENMLANQLASVEGRIAAHNEQHAELTSRVTEVRKKISEVVQASGEASTN